MPSSPADSHALEQETARRQAIRSSLLAWAKHTLEPAGFAPAAHHRLLIEELTKLTRGETDRLMILMPPGSAKSTYVSILFPAWWFPQHPASSIIAASHTADLAEHFGRQIRNLILANEKRLGFTLATDNRAAARWQISTKGEYYAAGIRGPITGRRADLAIIDDPIKSQAEADSPSLREHIWNWYRSDLLTRLKPKARVVLVMTRWHEDDLGGRLLDLYPKEWRCLRLPALAEANDPLGRPHGAPLWPEWEDASSLTRKRSAIGERAWAALFQQTPHPPDGNLFAVKNVQILDTTPAPAGRVVRAWDLAATEHAGGTDPDWTVGVKLTRDATGRFVILDILRLRGSPNQVEELITKTAVADGASVTIGIPQDPGQAGKVQVTYLPNCS